ncbi:MAG TPA: branched-chain amino acid ABC transporter ATP-binding protein/permease [Stellaceae bacterium]|jgi:branched-chain amino acid transport system permease protein|nr:branched-chain amino acid ABC transporter ATP-binding protein/permease [Stellaceae bacterium]
MTAARLRLVGLGAIVLLAVAPALVSPFSVTLLNFIGIYALAALGLVLLTGVGGMLSFGQAAFVGIAAYSTAWATTVQGWSPWLGLLLALALTGAVAVVLGAVTLRLRGHFLSLSTLAWGLAIFFLFGNIDGLGHFTGISDVPPIVIGPLVLRDSDQIFYLIWAVLIAALILSANLLHAREGRAIRALRGGRILVESLGIDGFRVKLATFVLAALLSALSGWLQAHMTRFVSPSPFDVTAGIFYLLMAMVGGIGNLSGAVVGAAIVTLSRNSIQDYLPLVAPGAAGQLEIVVFSVLFILLLQRARAGLVPFVLRYLPRQKPSPAGEAAPLERRLQPARGEPVLSVEGVTRRFGGLVAVNDVSFELRAGEILGLIGPNGAGKTTMFNLITGVLRADHGRIRFRATEITRQAQRRIARAGIARTFQHVKLRPTMSLLDNVLLGTYARTRSGFFAGALRLDRAEEASARYEAMRQLHRVGLAERAFDFAGSLPLGNQRLVEIARALAADPLLLVLDEPAAGLRRLEKEALVRLLETLRGDGLTILLVEHDMEFVMGLVDRSVVMDFGAKLCEGPPAEIRRDPRVQEAYLGSVA